MPIASQFKINGELFDSSSVHIQTSEGVKLQATAFTAEQNIEREWTHVLGSQFVAGSTPGVFAPGTGEITLLMEQWIYWYKILTKSGVPNGLRTFSTGFTLTFYNKLYIPINKIQISGVRIAGRSASVNSSAREAITATVRFEFELMSESGVLGQAGTAIVDIVNKII